MNPIHSFDVFDTVVTRAFAHPRDVFVRLGLLAHAQGDGPADPFAFARARWAAELQARKLSPHIEVVLDEIYRVLAAELGWDRAATERVMALELELESRHLHGVALLRPRLEAARAEAGRLVFLSDMYLPSAVMRSWLERERVMEPGDLLLISGEAKGSKSTGLLFEAARRATGGDFSRWHHVGDHPFADVAKPRQLGMTATHLTQAHLTARERAVRATEGEFTAPWRSLLAGAMRLARLERQAGSEREAVLWETGTTLAGPLFFGFVCWTLAEAERRGIRRLYFLARDGQIFHRVARAVQAARGGSVECHYLLASRLVLTGPAEVDHPAALRELTAPNGHHHSVRQAVAVLGLDESWARAHLPAPFRDRDLDADLPPAERQALADWLLAPERAADLRTHVGRRAATARAYLESVGLRAGEPVGLVDTGWLGSMQLNLERILGPDGAATPLTGFYLGLMPPRTAFAGEMRGYTNAFSPLPLLREESHKVLLELLAQSDHGQVTGYEEREGRWQVQQRDAGPVNLTEIQLVQDAVLAFTQRMLAVDAIAQAPEADFARTVIGLYRDFHDHPDARTVRVLGFLPHSDQLLEQKHSSLCAEPGLPALLPLLANHRRRPPHWWVGGQAALGQSLLLRSFRALKRLKWRLTGRPE